MLEGKRSSRCHSSCSGQGHDGLFRAWLPTQSSVAGFRGPFAENYGWAVDDVRAALPLTRRGELACP